MNTLFNRRGINIDITHRCPLECKRCQRFTSFTSKGLKVPGEDLSIEDF
jgi:acetolactate synthase small subunit